MRVEAHAADDGGCGWYRIIQPAEAIITAAPPDLSVKLVTAGSPEAMLRCVMRDLPDGSAECLDVLAPECDVLVIQRPMQESLTSVVPILQRKGVAVVVEIDDDFSSLSPRNAAWADLQRSPLRHERWLRHICDMADMVTVTTPRLASVYGRHGRVSVIPNQLPAALVDGASPRYRPGTALKLVGWSGSTLTHPDDLQTTRGAVGAAVAEARAGVFVVGTGVGVRERLALPDDVPLFTTGDPTASPPTGWLSIHDYLSGMMSCDVGIVPLELTPFNQAKSDLKGLEFAALGVPFVASPTGPYRSLADSGAGLIASKPKQWRAMVRRLLTDDVYRRELGEQAQQVTAHRRYHRTWHLWAEAWADALTYRRSLPGRAMARS